LTALADTAHEQEQAFAQTLVTQGNPTHGPRSTPSVGAAATTPDTEAHANLTFGTEARQNPEVIDSQRLSEVSALSPSRTVFNKLELREGVVLEIGDETFRARLVDPEDHEPDEEVDIDLDQISSADLPLVTPGALFFWAIGDVVKSTGRRQLVLKIEMRRLRAAAHNYSHEALKVARQYLEDLT